MALAFNRSYRALVYLGVALTTMGTLILELSLTRIFSVVFFYHFAFLAISMALFGLGVGGVFSHYVATCSGNVFTKIGAIAVLNAFAVPASLLFILLRANSMSILTLGITYFIAAVPFFMSGVVLSLAISETITLVHRVYFFDLMGAAAGCLLLIPLLNGVGGPTTVITAGALFALSSVCWFHLAGTRSGRNVGIVASFTIVALIAINTKYNLIDVKYAKGKALPQAQFVKWNSFSRVDVIPLESGAMDIRIDADAGTRIASFDLASLSQVQRRNLMFEGPGIPYVLRPAAKALIIGPGGGWDVSRALASGSRDITAVEINPIIANTIMQDKFRDFSRNLYGRPEVRIVVEDGRSFVRRSSEKYEVLQATLVDTWASTAAGAFALSENNLYTVDAFQEYLSHLTDTGIMTFTRWGFVPPRESLRLVSLAIEALRGVGEKDVWNHVIVCRETPSVRKNWGSTDTVIVARKPFSPEDVNHARSIFQANSSIISAVYLPGDSPTNQFGELLLASDPHSYEKEYEFNITPVDDNRPFFFYTVQPRDLFAFVRQAIGGRTAAARMADYKVNLAVPVLFVLMAVSLIATALVLVLPALLFGSRPRSEWRLASIFYFAGIGLGYILIEVALIQKFVLFLGHPTYALTVVVFSMLVSSGIGSYSSKSLKLGSTRNLCGVLLAVALLISMFSFLVSFVVNAGVGWPLGAKLITTVALIAPVAFLMGMPFPAGLSRLESEEGLFVRWAWSVNAASSVLGSAAAIFLALYCGLQATMLVGASMYVCALILVRVGALTSCSQARSMQFAPAAVALANSD